MNEFTAQQNAQCASFREFAEKHIMPRAGKIDREQHFPRELIASMAAEGYLGFLVPAEYGGAAQDVILYGLLNQEIGKACSSARTLLTVHGMATQAIMRWGTNLQKEKWLPPMAAGERLGAFALSEPLVGSDAGSIQTSAQPCVGGYVLKGIKKWISFGQLADVFLLFARCMGLPTAFLVEKGTPGLEAVPLWDVLGTRGSMLAEIHLKECFVPQANMIGRPGFGFSHVATSALDQGKYSVAWGCVGIGQACLEESVRYAHERKQFGSYLKDHQLVRRMIANMIVNVKAARLLCLQAGRLKAAGSPNSLMETNIAKLFASTMAVQAATDAIQIQGANGCSGESNVARCLRDAKVMEIIEGTTEIQQISIAQYGFEEYLATTETSANFRVVKA